MLTLLPGLSSDWLLPRDAVRGAACALHMGACVREEEGGWSSGSQSCLGTVDRQFLQSWGFGTYQASAPSSIIHSLSSVSPASDCLCVSVCGYNMLSVDLWGTLFLLLLLQVLLFFAAFSVIRLAPWTLIGQKHVTSLMDSVQLIYFDAISEGSSG